MRPKIFKLILMLCVFLVGPGVSFAANISLETNGVGDNGISYIEAYLNPLGKSINTVSGVLDFGDMEIVDIITGNSLINYWVEAPEAQGGQVTFSGITPGGLQEKSLMFVVEVKLVKPGKYSIRGIDLVGLLNDGDGTEIQLSTTPSNLEIGRVANLIENKDPEPPEAFQPLYIKDENVFNGNRSIIFYAQDKGSGISKYEIKEGILGSFKEAQSPYKLTNKVFRNIVYVKAIDGNGNVRIEKIWVIDKGELYLPFVIILTIIILVAFFKRIKK